MSRKWIAACAALLLTACQGGQQESSDSMEAPDVSPSAAPGVAFRYLYAFELPDEAISAVQEAHAARCESLGTGRCRITGLTYSVNADNAVSASLTVKLVPDIARTFGKEATAAVTEADGRLRSTEFTGTDTVPVTSEASRQQADVRSRIADIERQLAAASTGAERAQLQMQLNELRTQLSQTQSTIAGAAEQLASTPMTFNYYGRGGITGFRTNPLRDAGRLFVSSIVTMVSAILQVLAVLLPWLVLIALLVWFARTAAGRAVGRFFGFKRSEPQADE